MKGVCLRSLGEVGHLSSLPWKQSVSTFDKALSKVEYIVKLSEHEATEISRSKDPSAWVEPWLYYDLCKSYQGLLKEFKRPLLYKVFNSKDKSLCNIQVPTLSSSLHDLL